MYEDIIIDGNSNEEVLEMVEEYKQQHSEGIIKIKSIRTDFYGTRIVTTIRCKKL